MNEQFPFLNQAQQQRGFQNNNFQMQPQMNVGINWVQGIEGANALQLNPNSIVLMLDSTKDVMYIKSTDNIGMPNLRTFEFVETTGKKEEDKYLTKEEFKMFLNNFNGGAMNNDATLSTNAKPSNGSANNTNKGNVKQSSGKTTD